MVDFCGGISNVTRKIAEHLPVSNATIIDIDEEFLNIAQSSGIKTKKLETVHSDILDCKNWKRI